MEKGIGGDGEGEGRKCDGKGRTGVIRLRGAEGVDGREDGRERYRWCDG